MKKANQGSALPMKLEIRLSILFGCLLAAFLAVLMFMHAAQRRSAFELQTEIAGDKSRQLTRALTLTGSTLERFAADYTQWDEMVAFVASAAPEWATINLEQSLASWRFHGVWVLSPERREVYRHLREPLEPADLAGFPTAEMAARLCTPEKFHFFLRSPRGLLEIRTSPIHPSDDRYLSEPPQGWLVVARLWEDGAFTQLGELTDSTITLQPAAPVAVPAELGPRISATMQLPAWDGKPLAYLQLEHMSPLLLNMIAYDRDEGYLLFGFGLVFFVCAAGCLHFWVRRPLRLIERSLVLGRPELVAPLEGQHDEFGHVARLVRTVSEQRRELSREVEDRTFAESELRHAIAERAALGRDLHDGAIQSIYAIGMALQGIAPLLRSAPDEAQRRIEACVEGLNRTITQLRGYIAGLEEDGAAAPSLAEGLQTLLREMRPAKPVDYEVRLDPELAAALRPDEIVQLLYIAREAVSNSVRHGLARRITLELARSGAETVFTIGDDGVGFDPSTAAGRGHGLDNMTRRAEEIGASLTVDAAIARGARLRVELPRSSNGASAHSGTP
ncbi:MAG TPA: CHASE4 domain-containing protein [Opitutaceae bacterium]|nr:CHASE4 domain-containing protein [Opitutaceae bacterium]